MGFALHWTNFTAFLGVGLLTIAFGVWRLRGRARRSRQRDPYLAGVAQVQAAMSNPHLRLRPEEHARPSGRGRDRTTARSSRSRVVSLIVFAAVDRVGGDHHEQGDRARAEETGAGEVASEIGRQEIGIVDQVPFATDQAARAVARRARRRVSTATAGSIAPRASPTSRSRRRWTRWRAARCRRERRDDAGAGEHVALALALAMALTPAGRGVGRGQEQAGRLPRRGASSRWRRCRTST